MLLPRSGSPPGETELGYRLRRPATVFVEREPRRSFAETMAVNSRSRRVLEKAGLRYRYIFFPPFAPIEGSEHGEVC